MHPTVPTTRLLPQQIRVINARHGLCLRVVCGRFWLTQPNASQDLFLGPGSSVDLWQDGVVISADAWPRRATGTPDGFGEYQLMPLVGAQPQPGRLLLAWRAGQRRLAPLMAATRSAWLGGYAR